jgi:acyl-coenzyme A thioesterase PaaI-like protein
VTDLPNAALSVPNRLGVTARLDGGALKLDLTPAIETLRHGVVRASVLSYIVDAVAGIEIDDDPDVWTLTSDMTVRMQVRPAPGRVTASSTALRRGRRSVTSHVELTTEDGTSIGVGAIGFAKIPRRPSDPPKPQVSIHDAPALFGSAAPLDEPLRDAAGIEVVDAAAGVVQIAVTPELRNPAGTLQGAMVALVAEAAVEEMATMRFESPAVVTDLDLRYLAQAHDGPVRTTCRVLGTEADAPVEVRLTDTTNDRLTTLVYARAAAV